MYTRIGIQIEFARPHISDTYPDSLWEYWQQSMSLIPSKICILQFASTSIDRTGRRGCHLEQYSR